MLMTYILTGESEAIEPYVTEDTTFLPVPEGHILYDMYENPTVLRRIDTTDLITHLTDDVKWYAVGDFGSYNLPAILARDVQTMLQLAEDVDDLPQSGVF